MKKCPRCELNYINDYGELCDICKRELKIGSSTSATDNNKQEVEKYLIPFLKALSPDKIELFTRKDISYEAFKLRLPLLVKCNNEYRVSLLHKSIFNKCSILPYLFAMVVFWN